MIKILHALIELMCWFIVEPKRFVVLLAIIIGTWMIYNIIMIAAITLAICEFVRYFLNFC